MDRKLSAIALEVELTSQATAIGASRLKLDMLWESGKEIRNRLDVALEKLSGLTPEQFAQDKKLAMTIDLLRYKLQRFHSATEAFLSEPGVADGVRRDAEAEDRAHSGAHAAHAKLLADGLHYEETH